MEVRTLALIIIAVVAAVVLLLGFFCIVGYAVIKKAWEYIWRIDRTGNVDF